MTVKTYFQYHRLVQTIRSSLIVAMCVILTDLAVASSVAPQPFEATTLDNGLEVLSYASHKVPLVTLLLCVRGGAMTETPATHGYTQILQHLLWNAHGKFKTQDEFLAQTNRMGVTFQSETSVEYTRYYLTMPSVYLKEGLQLFYGVITQFQPKEEELKQVINTIAQEFNETTEDPSLELARLKRQVLYQDQAFRRDPRGDLKVILAANSAQLLSLKNQLIVPHNAALVITGDFNPNLLLKEINDVFGSWQTPSSWQAPSIPDLPKFPKSVDLIKTSPRVSQVRVSLAFEGPKARKSPEPTYALDVLALLLQQESGKFQKKLVASGLASAAGLSYLTQSHAGEINLFGVTTPDKAQEFKKQLESEPKAWLDPQYFSETALVEAKRRLTMMGYLERDRPSEYAKVLSFWWAITGHRYFANYQQKLMAVTLEDVKQTVQSFLVDKPRIGTILLSPESAATAGLKDNTQVPVVPNKH